MVQLSQVQQGEISLLEEPPGYTNTIEFITIATTGNGQDFGDLTVDANRGYQDRTASICDTTRGIFSGGFTGSNVLSNTIEFITMATTGNSTNFGDLPVARRYGFGTSNSRLAIFAGGYTVHLKMQLIKLQFSLQEMQQTLVI